MFAGHLNVPCVLLNEILKTDVTLAKYTELFIATVLARKTVDAQHFVSSFLRWVAIYRR
jgi:hypothetical protein